MEKNIVLEKPDQSFLIKSMKDFQSCKSVKLLGTNNMTSWEITENGLLIKPSGISGEHAWVYKIELK